MKILKSKKYSMLQMVAKYGFIVVLAFVFILPITSIGAGVNINTGIENPLGSAGPQDLPSFIQTILNVVLVIGVPIVTLAIIYTGFLFVKAQGKPEDLKKAKETLLYVLIGAALLLGSFVISKAIKGTVEEIIKTS